MTNLTQPDKGGERRRRLIRRAVAALVIVLLVLEVFRFYGFYDNVSAARADLVSLRGSANLEVLEDDEASIMRKHEQLGRAESRLTAARGFADSDPILMAVGWLPFAGRQVEGLRATLAAAEASTAAGGSASELLLAYTRQRDDPDLTSVQEGLAFLHGQESQMAEVRRRVEHTKDLRKQIPSGMMAPLQSAVRDLDDALDKIEGLITGYERANLFLPELFGINGERRYLVLPQNDTELFPSGGLISSYGVATFDRGRLTNVGFEYFVVLFDRWQRLSGGEYVEPPLPLQQYLLRNVSWGLGEAGWYPDFPTTASLARMFADKGGVAPTNGTIAMDLQFVKELLSVLGPVQITEYGVTVTAENLDEVTLANTRGESAVPGAPGKAFLSGLAKGLLDKIFAAPKSQWPGLLKLMDRMAKERHLQMNMSDPALQSIAREYGLDGSLVETSGDFLLIADTSVNSTKLNLILETSMEVDIRLQADGKAVIQARYETRNPFPTWQQGRDPRLVEALMLNGVYGSYLRLYAPPQASLLDLKLDGRVAGAEQADAELGKRVFGRFFPVLPGEKTQAEFEYEVPSVVRIEDGNGDYRLYIQKEAGTGAIPVTISIALPQDSALEAVLLDGQSKGAVDVITTDLQHDRVLEVVFKVRR